MVIRISSARRRWIWSLAAAAALVTTTAAAQKFIGTLRGYEYLENPVWTEAKDPKKKGYSFREMVPTVPAKYRRLSAHLPKEVCMAALAEEEQKPGTPVLIRVGGGRTTPVTIVVVPGTKLVFENKDPFEHRLYIAGDSSFAPNDTSKGGKREWSVPKAGVFEIRDERAPSLRMWVVGEPRVSAISYPSMKGAFNLSPKEEGEYEVQAYFSGKKAGDAVTATLGRRDKKLKPITVAKAPQKESK